MNWRFWEKRAATNKLIFNSNHTLFEYFCLFMDTEIVPRHGLPALVMDCKALFGWEQDVIDTKDGGQMCYVKVPSSDGGFSVSTQTIRAGGPKLKADDLVIWVPLELASLPPSRLDPRFAWVGLVVSKIKPEFDLTTSELSIEYDY